MVPEDSFLKTSWVGAPVFLDRLAFVGAAARGFHCFRSSFATGLVSPELRSREKYSSPLAPLTRYQASGPSVGKCTSTRSPYTLPSVRLPSELEAEKSGSAARTAAGRSIDSRKRASMHGSYPLATACQWRLYSAVAACGCKLAMSAAATCSGNWPEPMAWAVSGGAVGSASEKTRASMRRVSPSSEVARPTGV